MRECIHISTGLNILWKSSRHHYGDTKRLDTVTAASKSARDTGQPMPPPGSSTITRLSEQGRPSRYSTPTPNMHHKRVSNLNPARRKEELKSS